MTCLTGETALITGPGSRIASAIARAFVAEGVEVEIADDVHLDTSRRPVSIRCDLAATRADATKVFVLCRWNRTRKHGRDVHVLMVRPVSRLATMGLLVPGVLSARVIRTAGVAHAESVGFTKTSTYDAASTPDLVDGGALGSEVVAALRSGRYLLALRREWEAGLLDDTLSTPTHDYRLVTA